MTSLSSFRPAVARSSPREALRAGTGAIVGLGLSGFFVLGPAVDPGLGFYLVAPFGASSVLLFAVRDSPLAQSWPAVVGAVMGVAVCAAVEEPVARVALAWALRSPPRSCAGRCTARGDRRAQPGRGARAGSSLRAGSGRTR